MGRKRQEQIKLDFTLIFIEGTREYDAAYYLNNGPIPQEEAFIIAIAATFSMLGAAMRGADELTVRDRISYSDEAIHGFQMRALGRIEQNCSVFETNVKTPIRAESTQVGNLIDQNEAF